MSRELPEGWWRAKLGEICREDRVAIGNNDPAYAAMPYLGLEHIESNRGRILVTEEEARQSDSKSNNFRFTAEHVLYGKLRPYLNKVALPEFSGRCTTEIIPLLPVGTDRRWLAWLLRQEEVVEHAMRGKTGSRMPRTSMRDFMELPVAVPPLEEQMQIVAHLEDQLVTAERARTAALSQLAAIEAMPQALLRQIFPRSPAQRLPLGWRWAELGEVTTSSANVDPRRNPDMWFTYIDISGIDRVAKRIRETKRMLGFDAPSRARRSVRAGDVIVSTTRPNLNAVALIPDNYSGAICSTGFCVLRCKPEADEAYLYQIVQTEQFIDQMTRDMTGASYPAVTDKVVRAFKFPLPPFDEQRRIVRDLDEQAAAAEHARAAAQAQLDAIDALPVAVLRLTFAS